MMDKRFFKSVFKEGIGDKIVCVYSGRFQPFGPHHFQAYQHLCQKFGIENVIIATSDSISSQELSFDEKNQIISKYGIGKIAKVSSPYRPVEITQFLPSDVALVIAVGEKDSNRIDNSLIRTTKSGSPGYYSHFKDSDILLGYRDRGYIYTIPKMNVYSKAGDEISGTALRSLIPKLSREEFSELMGWYDYDAHELMISKFSNIKIDDLSMDSKQRNKHISHPWEVMDFTLNDLLEIGKRALSGNLENVTEKIDGQNLLVTFNNGEIRFARNKSEILNPLSILELNAKFGNHPTSVQTIFYQSASNIRTLFLKSNSDNLRNLFDNSTFLNLEIVDSRNPNVINYGPTNFLIFHSLIRFDANGNEISRKSSNEIYDILKPTHLDLNMAYTIMPSRKLILPQIYKSNEIFLEFSQEVDGIWKKYNLTPMGTIRDLVDKYTQINGGQFRRNIPLALLGIEMAFSKLGYLILNEIDVTLCKGTHTAVSDIMKKISRISNAVKSSGTPEQKLKFNSEFTKLKQIGGLSTILPIEGIVFNYNGYLLKMTGSFRYVNQILGIFRYSR